MQNDQKEKILLPSDNMPFIETKLVQKRRIGDKDVFPVGFGTMGLSVAYGTPSTDDEERMKVNISSNQPLFHTDN